MIPTYLAGATDPLAIGSLRIGDRLPIRPGTRGRAASAQGGLPGRLEVRSPSGQSIGYLPLEDSLMVVRLLDAGGSATARVRSVVPSFPRLRVQLDVEIEPN
jgi:hypothetical protein